MFIKFHIRKVLDGTTMQQFFFLLALNHKKGLNVTFYIQVVNI